MNPKIAFLCFTVCIFSLSTFSCPNTNNQNGEEEKQPASIHFINHSSFSVDIYKNFNPNYYDSTTLVCSVNAGQDKTIPQYASADQKMGDTFYVRYKLQLADRFDTGSVDIFADARRDMSNISFVIKNGESYTKTIPQPEAGQLRFVQGYIAVQNTGLTQVRIINGIKQLPKMDNEEEYLYPEQNIGYYEIAFPAFMETLTINQLKASGASSDIKFPDFAMERGKLCVYSFTVTDSTVSGPVIIDIDPFN